MSLERRVRDALQEQADHVDIDLSRVRRLTEEKSAAPRRRRTWSLLAAAAAVAVVAGGVTTLARSVGPAPSRPPAAVGPHAPKAGAVAATFSCPHRSTVRFGPGATNLSFVPSLEKGPRWFAAQMQAPRFLFQSSGSTATLRLGNADGSLGSVSTFTRTPDGRWDVVRATRCVNGPSLADNPHRIGVLSSSPPFAAQRAREVAGDCGVPTFVDGHGYYDAAGLLRHEWTYAARCPDGSARLTMVMGTGAAAVPLPAQGTLKPVDLSRLLPAEVRGQVALWGLFDPHHSVADVSVQLTDGQSIPAAAVRLHGQPGTVFLAMAPRTEVGRLAVHPMHGVTRSYTAVDPPGYRR